LEKNPIATAKAEEPMRKLIPIFAAACFALSAGGASAFTPSLVAVKDTLVGPSSYAGSTNADISSTSSQQGVKKKKRGFCPPGQAKKPGRGSAFNC